MSVMIFNVYFAPKLKIFFLLSTGMPNLGNILNDPEIVQAFGVSSHFLFSALLWLFLEWQDQIELPLSIVF